MKKIIRLCCLLAVILVTLLTACIATTALAAGKKVQLPEGVVPIYRARLHADTRIRNVQDMDSRDWQGLVPEDAFVDVYEYGEEWSLCGYKGDVGWIPTDRLYEMWVVSDVQLPGFVPMYGLAIMLEDAFVTVDGYEGNALKPGDTVVVADAEGAITMNRDMTQLPAGSFRVEPFVSADEAKPGDALYGFTTWYQVNEKKTMIKNRVHNIDLGVERLTGTVVYPGEEFSFNAVCGPYTTKNGFKNAPNISLDGYGVGGGVCQVSTTLYQATMGLDVQRTVWYVHSYYGVTYALRNHDCAVGGGKDFCFVNNYDFPIEITITSENGVLTCVVRRGGK